jgi:hypothetical protein
MWDCVNVITFSDALARRARFQAAVMRCKESLRGYFYRMRDGADERPFVDNGQDGGRI